MGALEPVKLIDAVKRIARAVDCRVDPKDISRGVLERSMMTIMRRGNEISHFWKSRKSAELLELVRRLCHFTYWRLLRCAMLVSSVFKQGLVVHRLDVALGITPRPVSLLLIGKSATDSISKETMQTCESIRAGSSE